MKEIEYHGVIRLVGMVAFVGLVFAQADQGNVFYDKIASQHVGEGVVLHVMTNVPDIGIDAHQVADIFNAVVYGAVGRNSMVRSVVYKVENNHHPAEVQQNIGGDQNQQISREKIDQRIAKGIDRQQQGSFQVDLCIAVFILPAEPEMGFDPLGQPVVKL